MTDELGSCPLCGADSWVLNADQQLVCSECYAALTHPDVTEYKEIRV